MEHPRVIPREEEASVPAPVVGGAYGEVARVEVREGRQNKIETLTDELSAVELRMKMIRESLGANGVSDAVIDEFEGLMDKKKELAAELHNMGVEPEEAVKPTVH